MNTHANKTQEDNRPLLANGISQRQGGGQATLDFVNNRPEAISQGILQKMANDYCTRQQLPIQQKENSGGILQLSRKSKINVLRNSRFIQENFFEAIRTSVEEQGEGEDNDGLARKDAQELGIIAETIEGTYPDDEYLYVGIGSSPDIILELLHLRGARTISIPVSGVKDAIPQNKDEEENAIDYITGQLKDFAYEPINLLLLDATETNATLTTITNLIKKSDAKKGVKRIIKSASITQTKTYGPGIAETIEDSEIEVLNINDRATKHLMRVRFFQQEYKRRIGRSSPKVPFKDIIAGKNPNVEFNEADLASIMRFTRQVAGIHRLEDAGSEESFDDSLIEYI
ncbi:MAG TPA: hypothetical protein ENJ82_05680 [Bacteroidetes bacterium]|nr:hypothetical protein [Bacteroidota bacterium]